MGLARQGEKSAPVRLQPTMSTPEWPKTSSAAEQVKANCRALSLISFLLGECKTLNYKGSQTC